VISSIPFRKNDSRLVALMFATTSESDGKTSGHPEKASGIVTMMGEELGQVQA